MIYYLGTILAIYIGICVVFYFFQDFFFFRPEKLPQNFQFKYPYPFEEKKYKMEDGGNINAIHFKVPNALGVIYYLKGNSKSIKGWGKFAQDFLGNGYDFFMIDYRGFGKSKGKRTESILYSDAQYLYKKLCSEYQETNIIIYGRSFGTGVATRIASWNNPQRLILDSPYYSFKRLIKRKGGMILPLKYLLRYKMPSNQFLEVCQCPIDIIHGTKDLLIPVKHHSQVLKNMFPRINLHLIASAHHNNLPKFKAFHLLLYELLNQSRTNSFRDLETGSKT